MLQPIFDSTHVDLVLNGHDHSVSCSYPIKADTFVEKPSQGTVYYVTGRSGNKAYDGMTVKVWDAFFYNPLDMPNYIVAEASDEKFKLMLFKQDGTPLDTCIIDRSKDALMHGTTRVKTPERYKAPTVVVYGIPSSSDKAEFLNNKWYFPEDVIKKYSGYTCKDYKSMNMLMFSKDGKH
jgi:hypothetical protein